MPRLSPRYVSLIHELIRALAHIAEYFFMGLLLSRAFYSKSRQIWNLRWSVFIIILLALLALSDEFYQSFFPSRKASLVDVGLDLIGGFLSQIAMTLRGKVIAINSRR
jgi:VanZ family protein